MIWRRLAAALTGLVAALLAVRWLTASDAPARLSHPAMEFHTRNHDGSYGGIDRWARYGMEAGQIADLLKRDGYNCDISGVQLGALGPAGPRNMVCRKQLLWPLERTLMIRASLDGSSQGRLVAATASSVLVDGAAGLSRTVENVLRSAGLIEPEKLQIRGGEFDTVDLLAQYVLDALDPSGWRELCDQQADSPTCRYYVETRRESGFPSLTQRAMNVRDALSITRALEGIQFMPARQRGADGRPEDALLLRIDGDTMWMDFTSQDLAGRKLAVSIGLDPEGGAPVQLVAQLGWEKEPAFQGSRRQPADSSTMRFVPLVGKRRQSNAGVTQYLVPIAGAEERSYAIWINMPEGANPHPHILRMWAEVLPTIELAFQPRIIHAAVSSLAKVRHTDEALGLYPMLTIVERRAELLRKAEVAKWIPPERGDQDIRQAFRDDPVTRAAWGLAMCETTAPPSIDVDCWRRLVANDDNVVELLRREVARLGAMYAELDPAHPVRLRLKRLEDVLSPDGARRVSEEEPRQEQDE